jgi:arsenate reductase (thioredoxin)
MSAAPPPPGRSVTNILFVCIGNSCRSQMAEAMAKKLGKGKVRAWSAGLYPLGWIASGTHIVMEENAFFLDGQSSKSLKEVNIEAMDIVVKMGREVSCALPKGFKGRVVEWEIPDPFGATLDEYRKARDLIEEHVTRLLVEIESLDSP